MITTWFDRIEIGERTRTTARTITETDIVQFAMLSGDWFPLHIDTEYAATTAYGERIAHGMLVLTIATGLITLAPPYVVAFYGIDWLRFVNPVKIGDTIHVETEVFAKQLRNDTVGVVSHTLIVKNQRDEDVIVATTKMAVAREPA
ncbi:MAG: MaoC family dehydratase N-terminal domain-containing protein [Herpetosiphonaceae bacterium]|nr:MaoC family dehydratase N-terminal domain-containing protein [Herpetosiphonaceae bacterium]